jgi:serine kinase of HPr protein (carbohydrate metabolism regulator)
LPVFFSTEEIYDFLHAGAVEVDDKPILFIAQSFGGKSTLTDYFIKQGHRLISDDKVAVIERGGYIRAIPSHPHHRPYRKMEDLGFFVEDMMTELQPIHAIYELERTKSDADIVITELKGMEKFTSLRVSSEMNLSFLKTKRFSLLMQISNQIPVYKVSVPWSLERLAEVHAAITEHTMENEIP